MMGWLYAVFDMCFPSSYCNNEHASKLVVQRNDLINARFALTTLERRLFRAMLARINRADKEFHKLRIPVTEVVAVSGRWPSSNDYLQLKDMCALLASRVNYVERPGKKKIKRGDWRCRRPRRAFLIFP